MKQITVNWASKKLICDDEDYDLLYPIEWAFSIRKGRESSSKFVIKATVNGKTLYPHRLVMGNPSGIVDHIDRDVFNVQKSNLRVTTNSINVHNQLKEGKYKGVFWHSRDKVWTAAIRKDKQLYHLGQFATKEDAALAYNRKAIELYGENAVLNQIEICH